MCSNPFKSNREKFENQSKGEPGADAVASTHPFSLAYAERCRIAARS